MKPSYLMDHMVTDGAMTIDEEEKIRAQVSLSREKIMTHVELLNTFVFFLAVFFLFRFNIKTNSALIAELSFINLLFDRYQPMVFHFIFFKSKWTLHLYFNLIPCFGHMNRILMIVFVGSEEAA